MSFSKAILKGVFASHFLKAGHLNCRQASPAPPGAWGEMPEGAGRPRGTRCCWHLCKENRTKRGRKLPEKHFVEIGLRFQQYLNLPAGVMLLKNIKKQSPS